MWLMNKSHLHCRRHHPCPIIRWNKTKDKRKHEVILLAILSCSLCKIFPAVQDCSKLHMLSLVCCAKKLATSCWERFSEKEWELKDLLYLYFPRSLQATGTYFSNPCIHIMSCVLVGWSPCLWEKNISFNIALSFPRSILHFF